MKSLISVNELIQKAQARKIDLGKGDPYNRLRYYTKMGWLPHMIRKNDQGHYPEWVLERLEFIDTLKEQNLSNEEITKKIDEQNRLQNVEHALSSKQIKFRVLLYVVGVLLAIYVMFQLDLIEVRTPQGADKFLNRLEFSPRIDE
jgi:DNA-binding transcriptional MerR regulator